MDQTESLPAGARLRTVDGTTCTDRDALSELTGKSRKTIDTLALTDPDFPTPAGGRRIDRRWWYPLDQVHAYAAELRRRDQVKKPPAADTGGDPAELLDPAAAADVLHISHATFRSYVRYSLPRWQAGQPALLPPPDEEQHQGARVLRRWRRDTLVSHQASRPGRGAGAGRRANERVARDRVDELTDRLTARRSAADQEETTPGRRQGGRSKQ